VSEHAGHLLAELYEPLLLLLAGGMHVNVYSFAAQGPRLPFQGWKFPLLTVTAQITRSMLCI
jgi:hypothetical protein